MLSAWQANANQLHDRTCRAPRSYQCTRSSAIRMRRAMRRDRGSDAFRRHASGGSRLIRRTVEFFGQLLQLDFEQHAMGQAELSIRQTVNLCVRQRAQFLRISGLGSERAHGVTVPRHPRCGKARSATAAARTVSVQRRYVASSFFSVSRATITITSTSRSKGAAPFLLPDTNPNFSTRCAERSPCDVTSRMARAACNATA